MLTGAGEHGGRAEKRSRSVAAMCFTTAVSLASSSALSPRTYNTAEGTRDCAHNHKQTLRKHAMLMLHANTPARIIHLFRGHEIELLLVDRVKKVNQLAVAACCLRPVVVVVDNREAQQWAAMCCA